MRSNRRTRPAQERGEDARPGGYAPQLARFKRRRSSGASRLTSRDGPSACEQLHGLSTSSEEHEQHLERGSRFIRSRTTALRRSKPSRISTGSMATKISTPCGIIASRSPMPRPHFEGARHRIARPREFAHHRLRPPNRNASRPPAEPTSRRRVTLVRAELAAQFVRLECEEPRPFACASPLCPLARHPSTSRCCSSSVRCFTRRFEIPE